jgi:hypothetical protein
MVRLAGTVLGFWAVVEGKGIAAAGCASKLRMDQVRTQAAAT